MLVLLPPSAGKVPAGEGPAVELSQLTMPELSWQRDTVRAALTKICADPQEMATAREILGLSSRQVAALAANRDLDSAPTLPAAQRYVGVLYDALGLPELRTGPSGARIANSVLIFSGLWGVVGIDDQIPDYRLSMDVRLPQLGRMASFWRRHLTEPLHHHTAGQLLVDCRSTPYAAAFPAQAAPSSTMVTIRVLRERIVDGTAQRSVVSHHAKATRGAVARSLLTENVSPETTGELVEALTARGFRIETGPATPPGKPQQISVITVP